MVCVEERTGENSIVVVPGSNLCLTTSQVEDFLAKVDADKDDPTRRVLLLQMEVAYEINVAAAQMAKARGYTVVLNPAPVGALETDPSLLQHVDVLIPNETEVKLLAQQIPEALPAPQQPSATDLEGTTAAARALETKYRVEVIVTLGSNGSLVHGVVIDPHRPHTVIDTVGAGDCFCAAVAVMLSEKDRS